MYAKLITNHINFKMDVPYEAECVGPWQVVREGPHVILHCDRLAIQMTGSEFEQLQKAAFGSESFL